MSKTIKNKQTKISIFDETGNPIQNADYASLIKMCVNQPTLNPQSGQSTGFSVEEIRSRMRIIDVIESSKNGSIIVEDADYDLLKQCVQSYRWGAVSQIILDFVDDVTT